MRYKVPALPQAGSDRRAASMKGGKTQRRRAAGSRPAAPPQTPPLPYLPGTPWVFEKVREFPPRGLGGFRTNLQKLRKPEPPGPPPPGPPPPPAFPTRPPRGFLKMGGGPPLGPWGGGGGFRTNLQKLR
jgi:hypothetical protein